MNLRQLRYFVSVAEAGSFSRAAMALRVAQPSLSLQIGNLERDLGVPLLLRDRTGVQPTEAGERFLQRARTVLAEIKRIRADLQSGTDLEGDVSLGLPSAGAAAFAGAVVAAALSRHPGLRLLVVDAASHLLEDRLRQGSLDVAVLHDAATAEGLRQQVLFQQCLFHVTHGPPGDPETDGADFADLDGRTLVLPPRPDATRAMLDATFAATQTQPVVVAEADTPASLLSLVRAGHGGTVLPWLGPPDPGLHWSPLTDPLLCHTVSVCIRHTTTLDERVEAVQQVVAAAMLDVARHSKWVGAAMPPERTHSETQ